MPRKRIADEFEEINIMPLMNIIMLLIPFLILSVEFFKFGVINVSAPKLASGESSQSEPNKNNKPKLNLTVSVTKKGFTILTRGTKITQGCKLDHTGEPKLPTIPKIKDKYDFKALHSCLLEIKKPVQDEKRIIIMSEPTIKYETIVDVMDYSRCKEVGKKDCMSTPDPNDDLFPEVVLSVGIR